MANGELKELILKMPTGNGWSEWGKHVLAELIRLSNAYESLDKKFDYQAQQTEKRITAIETSLKNQKWAFGILSGALVSLFLLLIGLMFG